MSVEQQPFDPYAILAALDRQRVTYILIGGFARVIQGAEELTHGLDLTPSLRPENLRRLTLALHDLGAERLDHRKLLLEESTIRQEPILELRSPAGEIKLVPEPTGTRGGYDDLRRAANREPIGRGLRPSVASSGTSPACSPPSTTNETRHSSDSYDNSSSSNAAAAAASNANPSGPPSAFAYSNY